MKRLLLLLCFGLFLQVTALAQANEAIAKLKFEEAEEAFNSGNYQATITKLDEAEALLGNLNPRTLYLRILAQEKIVNQDPYGKFIVLESLRAHCNMYLQKYGNLTSLEDKYREVYKISESLNKYPKTMEEVAAALELRRQQEAERARLAEEKRQQEALRVQQEKERIAAQEAAKRAENVKEWNRSALAFGYAGGEYASYGFFIGTLNSNNVGFNFSLRSALLSPHLGTFLVPSDWSPTGERRMGKSAGNAGITFPIIFPVYGFVNAGLGSSANYHIYLDGDGTKQYVDDLEGPTMIFDSEVGLYVKAGPVILRGGLSLANFGEPEYTFGLGINLAGKYRD